MQALPRRLQFKTAGFPHSDISGSKATNRLPEAFRRLVASFIAVLGQGIHRVLLCLSYGDLHSTFILCTHRTQKPLPCAGSYLYIFRMSKIPVSPQTKTAPRGGFRVHCAPEALRPIRSVWKKFFGS